MGVWRGLAHCGGCGTLMRGARCRVCGWTDEAVTSTVMEDGGGTYAVPTARFGAIAYSTHLLLGMIRREWERPLHQDAEAGWGVSDQRAAIVLLFWTLFEILTERFFDAAMADYPERAREDLLRRYSGVGARLDRLYRIVFDTTFWADLADQGDGAIADHLQEVQTKRNAFAHGFVEAIDPPLIERTMEYLQDAQAAWITLYNRRCAGGSKTAPIWDERGRRAR